MSRIEVVFRPRGWMVVIALLMGLLITAAGATTAHAAGATDVQHRATPLWQGDGDDDGGGDDERPIFRGLIQQMPAGKRAGDWLIGGKAVVATGQTEFDETEGAFEVGVCVKVEFVSVGSTTAREIDSEPRDDCHDDGDDGEDGVEVYGKVEAMPSDGTNGVWTVSSRFYTVTAESELKPEYGAFEIGRCVKIELVAGTSDVVREMETARDYRCNRGDDDDDDETPPPGAIGHGELFGELKSFPPTLIGEWIVGRFTFSATQQTEFRPRNGTFTMGEIVKVEFYIMESGEFLAREIKSAYVNWDDDDDDGDHGDHHGHHTGHAFGVINQLPTSGLIGAWVVSGVPYTVTERTELRDRGGAFAISETVKIDFVLDSSGGRIAKEIKLMFPQGAPGLEEATLVGFVEEMPEVGYRGRWVVSGVVLSGTVQSRFRAEHGELTTGAYVKVEYRAMNGENFIREMETEVPPGAGDDDYVGAVESIDDSVLAAAATVNSTWQIGGRSYIVTPATRVDGALETSDTAWVNSYTAADGTQVATRIEGVAASNILFLPLMQR